MTPAMLLPALLIVDVQPTFCEGGELPVTGGNEVARRVANLMRTHRDDYSLMVSTQDWHINPGHHFSEDPDFTDTWPAHGVADTPNAQLHPDLPRELIDVELKKGHSSAAYSAFEAVSPDGRSLAQVLGEVRAVEVVGLALSHCVRESALDAKRLGYEVRVYTNMTVPVTQEQGEDALARFREAGIWYGDFIETNGS